MALGMLRLILLYTPHCSLTILTPTSPRVAPFRRETRYTMVVIVPARVSARREVVSHSPPPPVPIFVNKKSGSHKLSLQRIRRGFKSRRPRLLRTRTLDGLLHFSLSLHRGGIFVFLGSSSCSSPACQKGYLVYPTSTIEPSHWFTIQNTYSISRSPATAYQSARERSDLDIVIVPIECIRALSKHKN